jgi:hypothetical protein
MKTLECLANLGIKSNLLMAGLSLATRIYIQLVDFIEKQKASIMFQKLT